MIWIIGGTCEAVELAKRIRGNVDYIVTAATYGEKEFLEDENLVISRMDADSMVEFIESNSISLIVDMSHPYAMEVTANANEASKRCKVEYIRYVRKKTGDTDGCIILSSFDECVKLLKTLNGCVFFTTGSKNISHFEAVKGDNRFVYRVLPAVFSIDECLKNNVKMKDIVAALGPFSEELNSAMFKEYGADYVVMKDSGSQGGTYEKIAACRRLGIKAIVVGREEEKGMYELDEVIETILQKAAPTKV